MQARDIPDYGTLIGNGLAFGFAPQMKGALQSLVGEDYAAVRDSTQAQVDAARARLGSAGTVAEFAGALTPGAALAKTGSSALKLLPRLLGGKAPATTSRVAFATGEKAASPVVGKAGEIMAKLSDVMSKVPGVAATRAAAATPVGRAVTKSAATAAAASQVVNPESDFSKAAGDFFPRIQRQIEANGVVGGVGAAVGGGAKVAYEAAMAPLAAIPEAARGFMRGVTDYETPAQGPSVPTPEQVAEMQAQAAAKAQQQVRQDAMNKLVGSIASTPTDLFNARFPQMKAQDPLVGKTAWLEDMRQSALAQLQADVDAAKGDPALIQQAKNAYQFRSQLLLAPGGALLGQVGDE